MVSAATSFGLTATLTPKYQKDQVVRFVGGSGIIKHFQPESGTWTYLVEMELGPEPEMGRIGSETRILLTESDLTLHSEDFYPVWMAA